MWVSFPMPREHKPYLSNNAAKPHCGAASELVPMHPQRESGTCTCLKHTCHTMRRVAALRLWVAVAHVGTATIVAAGPALAPLPTILFPIHRRRNSSPLHGLLQGVARITSGAVAGWGVVTVCGVHTGMWNGTAFVHAWPVCLGQARRMSRRGCMAGGRLYRMRLRSADFAGGGRWPLGPAAHH